MLQVHWISSLENLEQGLWSSVRRGKVGIRDYSMGASGVWVDKGERAFPLEEATIVANWKKMAQSDDRFCKKRSVIRLLQTGRRLSISRLQGRHPHLRHLLLT